jgi:hypothetical protein
MTARIVHSLRGYLRYMQMSQAVVFAFVEGKKNDPYFYGQICAVVCNKRQIAYQICKANEIPSRAGGKKVLLEFYDFLRKQKALRTNLGGKDTIAVFFSDKDIDDILRQCRRSRHVIYTRYYDVENEIFLNGNLSQGCAAAASLDPACLAPLLSGSHSWCKRAAERWREWVVLCIIATLKGIRQQCNYGNYGVLSMMQNPANGMIDATKLAQRKAHMERKSGMAPTEFAALYASVTKRVRRLYSSGQQDKVFKGKWYPILLDEDIKRLIGRSVYNRQGFSARVTSAVAATLRFPDTWALYYTNRLADVVDNP